MGYSAFQEKGIQEALITRHENEFRLIETIKRCLSHRVKCDRDYAASLTNNVSQIGLKVERIEELNGNQIFKIWKKIMEEIEQQTKLIRTNAEQLETLCTGRILNLQQEKKKMKRQFQEDHSKISSRITQLTEDVARKKSEYQKNLEYYKQLRMRFEEHYIKAGRSGRKLDDMRDKYQKACRKLHISHNEYVLLINEAVEAEKDYRTILLPNLLENQRKQHVSFLKQWKSLLSDASKCIFPSSDKNSEVPSKIENFQKENQISTDDYQDFIEKYKSSALPILFRFDDQLIEDTVGKLHPNQLTVDNLTVEPLRNRLVELETSIKECQEKQKIKCEENNLEINSSSNTNGTNGHLSSINKIESIVNLNLESLKCEERQKNKLIEIIKSALNEVACEELPSGCDDLTELETKNSCNNHEIQSFQVAEILRKSSDFLSTVKRPFKKKWKNRAKHQSLSPSNTPLSDRASVARSSAGESLLTIATNRPLIEEEYFHGVLPREEVVRLLTNDGDFLVRETTRNDESQIVLSVCWNGHKHFIVQTTTEGHFRFEGPAFETIQELILHQYQSETPVTSRSGALITKPILRERWELSNDDVTLIEKIGRGNFGDVYSGKLKSTKQNVAVKTCKQTLPEEQKRKFLQEGRILKQYDHPNIVKLIGICVQKQPIMIVMELVEGGSLLMYLRKNAASLDLKQILSMCRDTAAGMKYLESKNCIHRDLAARNCLIGNENIVKISDFGMSREEEEYIVSDGMKQIPIKWTAPEALNFGKYNSLCDVWSYAVLVWEVFSKGGTPYSGMSNSKAREKIEEGYRMPSPEGTPTEIYELMLRCWNNEVPEDRPHFDEIYDIINRLLNKITNEDG